MSNCERGWDLDEEDEGAGVEWLAAIRDPGGIFRRQYVGMLVCLLLLLAAAGAATALFPMRYEARATILLSAKSIPDEFVPTTIIANILEQFEAIRGEVFSRNSLSKIITKTGVYARELDSTEMSGLAAKLGEELVVAPISSRSRSRGAPRSIAFEVTFAGEDPEVAATVVNTTVAELINANIEYRSRQARVTTEFMQREFTRADQALRTHQRELTAFRVNNRGSLPEEQEASLSKLERLEEQRRSAILRLSDYQSRLERIAVRPMDATAQPNLESLRDRVKNAKAVYTDDHPAVISLERQLAAAIERASDTDTDTSLPAAVQEEKRLIEEGIQKEQNRLAQIDEDAEGLEALLTAAPTIAEDYAALVRREQILQENYVEYLRKLKNAELALSLESSQQGAQLTRLDPAIPPTDPVLPLWIIAVAGVVVSLGGALAFGLLREILFPVIIDQQHLESTIPLPCLGSISRVA